MKQKNFIEALEEAIVVEQKEQIKQFKLLIPIFGFLEGKISGLEKKVNEILGILYKIDIQPGKALRGKISKETIEGDEYDDE